MRRLITAILAGALLAPGYIAAQSPSEAAERARDEVSDAVEECRANTDAERLEVDAADLCELKAWAEMGRQYPGAAETLVEQDHRLTERAGELTACRARGKRRAKRNERLAERVGEMSKRWRPWKVVLTTIGAVAVGFGAGYGVSELKK